MTGMTGIAEMALLALVIDEMGKAFMLFVNKP
jgi:hypothetical protein